MLPTMVSLICLGDLVVTVPVDHVTEVKPPDLSLVDPVEHSVRANTTCDVTVKDVDTFCVCGSVEGVKTLLRGRGWNPQSN